MSFVRMLGMAHFVPQWVDSHSDVVNEKDGDGFSITSVHLTVTARIPGIDQDTFSRVAAGFELMSETQSQYSRRAISCMS